MKNLLGFLLAFLLTGCAHAHPQSSAADQVEIRAVIEAFNRALQTRDKDAYVALFLHDNVTWQSVMDDFQLDRERRKNPRATRAQVDPNNTHLTFIDNIVKNPKVGGAESPPSFPIAVDTDGDVASASQDYRYFYEGREVGRGRAIWLLVKTEQGWKITAVIYSKRQPKSDGNGT